MKKNNKTQAIAQINLINMNKIKALYNSAQKRIKKFRG